MSISALNSLNARTKNSVYSKKGSTNKFSLNSSGVEKEIKLLEQQVQKKQISEEEFRTKKDILESLPQVLYTKNGSHHLSGCNASQIDKKDTEDSIKSITRKHELGDMSDFAYRANMHLLTTPIPQDASQVGQHLSYYA